MSVTVTVVAPAAPGRVWARWADLERWPDWNPHCVEARLEGPLAPGTRVDMRLRHPRGRDFYTRPFLTAVEPERELAWEARGLGLRAVTRTTLTPEPDGTRVTLDAQALGPLAATYRLTLPEKTQALIYVAMLNALTDSVRA